MLHEFVFSFAKLVATTVSGTAKFLLANVEGLAGDGGVQEETYGQIGVVVRPRYPTSTGYAEVLCSKGGDNLYVIGGRDARTHARFPAPKDGDVALVHDGGAFLSLSDNGDTVPVPSLPPGEDASSAPLAGTSKSTVITMLAPQVDGSGAVSKSHALILDASSEGQSASLIHMLGMALLMTKEKNVILKNADGSQWIQLSDSAILLNGTTQLLGGVVVGNAPMAQPVALAPDLIAWAGQVNAALAALKVALATAGSGGNAAVNPGIPVVGALAPTVAATTLKASAM